MDHKDSKNKKRLDKYKIYNKGKNVKTSHYPILMNLKDPLVDPNNKDYPFTVKNVTYSCKQEFIDEKQKDITSTDPLVIVNETTNNWILAYIHDYINRMNNSINITENGYIDYKNSEVHEFVTQFFTNIYIFGDVSNSSISSMCINKELPSDYKYENNSHNHNKYKYLYDDNNNYLGSVIHKACSIIRSYHKTVMSMNSFINEVTNNNTNLHNEQLIKDKFNIDIFTFINHLTITK